MKELLHQIDPSGVLGYVFLAGVIVGQLLIGRTLRSSIARLGGRLGLLAGRVNKVEGHLRIDGTDGHGGE